MILYGGICQEGDTRWALVFSVEVRHNQYFLSGKMATRQAGTLRCQKRLVAYFFMIYLKPFIISLVLQGTSRGKSHEIT